MLFMLVRSLDSNQEPSGVLRFRCDSVLTNLNYSGKEFAVNILKVTRHVFIRCSAIKRLVGFEPTYLTWQASTLTRLCYSRISMFIYDFLNDAKYNYKLNRSHADRHRKSNVELFDYPTFVLTFCQLLLLHLLFDFYHLDCKALLS